MPQPAQQQQPPGSTAEMDPRPDHGEQSYRGRARLVGKRALITGADSGIGKAVAIAFAREGADLVLSYLEEDDDAQDTLRLVEEAGREGILVRGDLDDPAHCRELVQRTVDELGGIDVLVSNAAFQMTHHRGPTDPLSAGRRVPGGPGRWRPARSTARLGACPCAVDRAAFSRPNDHAPRRSDARGRSCGSRRPPHHSARR